MAEKREYERIKAAEFERKRQEAKAAREAEEQRIRDKVSHPSVFVCGRSLSSSLAAARVGLKRGPPPLEVANTLLVISIRDLTCRIHQSNR